MSQSVLASAAAVVACPRCQKPLIDPAGLGWCQQCGYCRSLEEAPRQAIAAPTPAPANQLTATGAALGGIPKWFWITLLGIALVVGMTYAGGKYLRLAPLERALLTSLQIGFGVVIMFVGQLIGLARIAPEEASLSFKDAIFPFRLYPMIVKRLPTASLTIYLGCWGTAAIISAAVFVGGLGHWFTYLPSSNGQKTGANPAQKAKR